jgi:hypothetical protein
MGPQFDLEVMPVQHVACFVVGHNQQNLQPCWLVLFNMSKVNVDLVKVIFSRLVTKGNQATLHVSIVAINTIVNDNHVQPLESNACKRRSNNQTTQNVTEIVIGNKKLRKESRSTQQAYKACTPGQSIKVSRAPLVITTAPFNIMQKGLFTLFNHFFSFFSGGEERRPVGTSLGTGLTDASVFPVCLIERISPCCDVSSLSSDIRMSPVVWVNVCRRQAGRVLVAPPRHTSGPEVYRTHPIKTTNKSFYALRLTAERKPS